MYRENALMSIVKEEFLVLKKRHHVSEDNLFTNILVTRMLSNNFLDTLLMHMLHGASEHENYRTQLKVEN